MNVAIIALGFYACENGCKNQTWVLCFIIKWDIVSKDGSKFGIVKMVKEEH
jgi:hypothetical protein